MGERVVAPSKKTVLVVEDTDDDRVIFAAVLNYFGYRVTEAANAQEALDSVRTQRPDLILMDINLPLVSGLTISEVLKSDGATREIPSSPCLRTI
jgi:CheY-like chemotaxis protein